MKLHLKALTIAMAIVWGGSVLIVGWPTPSGRQTQKKGVSSTFDETP